MEGLTCAFQKREAVFRELSFSVRPGEVVAVTGPNGVGKTTLSRCLCGLLREQAGLSGFTAAPWDARSGSGQPSA